MSDNRPVIYPESDYWVYRASSIGKPLRCLAAARQQYDPLAAPDYLVRAAEAGNRYEDIVKNNLRSHGWEISGEQSEIDIVIETPHGLVKVRGHMDAESATPPDGPTLPLEVKSMSKTVWAKFQRDRFQSFPTYAAQIVTYMKAMNSPAAHYAIVNRDTDEIQTFIVNIESTPNLPSFKDITQKVLLVEFFATESTLPVCDTGTEYACPYEYLCDRREIYFTEIESADDEALIRLAQQYEEIRKLESDLKARKEDIRDEMTEAMGDAKKRQVPGFSFSLTTRTSKRLDTSKLRDRLGDELDDFYNESESAPFITVRNTST